MSTSFANDQGTGTVAADGFTNPSGGGASFPGIVSFGASVLAAAGANQGAAPPVTTTVVEVTATASTEGVKLVSGLAIIMVPGTIGVKVYPPANGRIGTLSTNTALLVAGGKSDLFAQITPTLWTVLKGA